MLRVIVLVYALFGFVINVQGAVDETPEQRKVRLAIVQAVKSNSHERLEYLLPKAINLKMNYYVDGLIAEVVIFDADEKFIDILLNHGLSVNYRDDYWGYTPLMIAAKPGKENIVDHLLSKDDCNLDIVDRVKKRTAEGLAFISGYPNIVLKIKKKKQEALKLKESKVVEKIGVKRKRLEYKISECVICLEDLVMVKDVLKLPCGHSFCRECVEDWKENSDSCPMCRRKFKFD